MHLTLNFNNETNVPSFVHWTGNEIEISGDFGEVMFDNDEEDNVAAVKYTAHRIGFKANPEHSVLVANQTNEYVGEIVVHMRSEDGSMGELSFMVALEDEEDSYIVNGFAE